MTNEDLDFNASIQNAVDRRLYSVRPLSTPRTRFQAQISLRCLFPL